VHAGAGQLGDSTLRALTREFVASFDPAAYHTSLVSRFPLLSTVLTGAAARRGEGRDYRDIREVGY